MSFTYKGELQTNEADLLRFLIGDTNSQTPILQDAEINYIITTTSNTTLANRLAVAFRAAATALAARAVKRSLGPQAEDSTQRFLYYRAMADKYEKIKSFSGTPPLPDYAADLVFNKDMMANEDV